jgi:hypothetical protein
MNNDGGKFILPNQQVENELSAGTKLANRG